MFATGSIAPASGVYVCVECYREGRIEQGEMEISKGDRLPDDQRHGKVNWRLKLHY